MLDTSRLFEKPISNVPPRSGNKGVYVKRYLVIPKANEVSFVCKKCNVTCTICTDDKNTQRWAAENLICYKCKDYKKLPYVPIDAARPKEVKKVKETFKDFFTKENTFDTFFS